MSIEHKTFRTLKNALKFIESLAFSREDYIFRGQRDSNWELKTTLARYRKIPHESWMSDIDEMLNKFELKQGIHSGEKIDLNG